MVWPFKKTSEKTTKIGLLPSIGLFAHKARLILEAAKGIVNNPLNAIMQQRLGEPHPHDMALMNKFYTTVPIIQGAINKIVDYTVGPGFRVEIEEERAKALLDAFMREMDFDNLLRNVVRDVLVYGNAYLEVVTEGSNIKQLIQRSPETIYVKRDQTGTVLGYSQSVMKAQKPIEFKLTEIIHFKLAKTGDTPYGLSIIHPLHQMLQRKLQMESDVSLITSRKANAPYDITVGDENNFPSEADITAVEQDLTNLENDHEWVHGPLIKVEALGFQDKAMNLDPYLHYIESQLIYGLEVPAVLLGMANVPEGLAKAQGDAFDRKITSIQLAIEQVLENDLFPRVLGGQSQAFADLPVEFQWKQPSPEEKLEEAQVMLQIANTGQFGTFSPEFMAAAQNRLAELLGFEDIEVTPKDIESQAQPIVPGQNKPGATKFSYDTRITEAFQDKLYDVPLKEFIGFNYDTYRQKIEEFVRSKDFIKREYKGFKFVPGTNQEEWEEQVIKYSLRDGLTKKQVEKLREVLLEAFDKGYSIRQIRKQIEDRVKPKDLRVNIPEVRDEEGEITRHAYTITMIARVRAASMARTETIRASNQGALAHFIDLDIKEVKWLATPDERVCPYCENYDGAVLGIDEADEMIPAHDGCRCSFSPIVPEANTFFTGGKQETLKNKT